MRTNFLTYQLCIEACLRAASASNNCATSCTQETDVKPFTTCIRLSMECASLCYSTAQLMSLGSKRAKDLCRICAELCQTCAAECNKHNCDYCQECAEACLQCADECRKLEHTAQLV